MRFKFQPGDRVRWANKALRQKISTGKILDIVTNNGVQPRYKIEILEGADAGLVVEPNAYWADVGGLEFAPDRIPNRWIPRIPRLVKRKRKRYRLWWSNASGCNANGCNGVLLGKYATRAGAEKDLFTALRECHELDDQDGLYSGLISCIFTGCKNIFVIDNLIPF